MPRPLEARLRLPALLALLMVAAAAHGDEPPPPEPGTASWPSGRVPSRSPRNELLLVPRLVLAAPRLSLRLVSWPVRELVILNARYDVYNRVLDALTSRDGLVGVRLAMSYALSYSALYGLSFFDERILGRGTGLYGQFEIGGPRLMVAGVDFKPLPAARRLTLDLEGAYAFRDDQYFYAIPSLTPSHQPQRNARYAVQSGDLWLRARLAWARPAALVLTFQLGVRRFGDGRPTGTDLPISAAYCVRALERRCLRSAVDDRLVPGFTDGTQFARVGARVHVDTFDRPGKPSAGLQLDLSADYTRALTDDSSYARLSSLLGVAINLWQRTHILFVRLRCDLLLPTNASTAPFTELPTLGGVDSLRGFRAGRFRDFSAVLASGEYRWPIWMWADGFVFAEWGGVAGRGFAGLALDHLYPDVGAGIRVRTTQHVMFRLQVAYGFPDGVQLYWTIGSVS